MSEALGAAASGVGLLLIGVASVEAIMDQVSRLPPPPPTPAEIAQGRPLAEAAWRRLYPVLAARLASDHPLELGEVWSTRILGR